jgi:hypothetical protein
MTIKIFEKFNSREGTEGVQREQATAELVYRVEGTRNDGAVRATVEMTLPAFYAGLPFDTYRIEPLGNGLWDVTARYSSDPLKESQFTFDTGGGTTHITQSLQTVAKHARPGKSAPDFKGAIGVTTDSVDETDITVPVYAFTETHAIPAELVTPAYKVTLFTLTGRTNLHMFKGFQPGEVLFLGASGAKRGKDDWEITYRFAASPNVSGLTIGDIENVDKRGWEYLWVRYADAEDEDVLVKQPIAVYVERVYEQGNFGLLGIE